MSVSQSHILLELRIDVSRQKKIFHKKTHTTPMEELNNVRTKHPDSKFTIQRTDDRFIGLLELNGKKYTTTYPYHKDHRYVRHKLCVALLQLAALENNHAFERLAKIQKYPVCVFGQTLQLTEDTEVEFKGSSDPNKIMHEDTAIHLSDTVVQTITAFLNTNGGSMYIGVHNGSRAVHGIKVNDIDKFALRWDGIIKTRILPRADHLVKIIPHVVVTTTTLSINEMRNIAFRKKIEDEEKDPLPLPPASPEVTTYISTLEAEFTRLQQDEPKWPSHFAKMQEPVYVLQFLVLPAATRGLYFADNIAYRRNHGANAKFGPEQLEQYYFARFKQEQKI